MNDIVSTRSTVVGITAIVIGTNVLCVDAVSFIQTRDTAELFWREQLYCGWMQFHSFSFATVESIWWEQPYCAWMQFYSLCLVTAELFWREQMHFAWLQFHSFSLVTKLTYSDGNHCTYCAWMQFHSFSLVTELSFNSTVSQACMDEIASTRSTLLRHARLSAVHFVSHSNRIFTDWNVLHFYSLRTAGDSFIGHEKGPLWLKTTRK